MISQLSAKRIGWCLALLLLITVRGRSIADETRHQPTRPRTVGMLQDYAERHRLTDSDGSGKQFQLRSVPLLAWTNPTRGDVSGALFLWVDGERPIAYGGIFLWINEGSKQLGREFHSLARETLTAKFDGQQFWTFAGPGIEYQSLPDMSPAGNSPFTRLRQIKRGAARFTVSISDPTTTAEVTRILPTPLYRYADVDSGVIDGAILAFVQGNDPELLLLIEVYSSGAEAPTWRYAVARCTTWAVRCELDGKQVIHLPKYDYRRIDRTAAFLSARRIEVE